MSLLWKQMFKLIIHSIYYSITYYSNILYLTYYIYTLETRLYFKKYSFMLCWVVSMLWTQRCKLLLHSTYYSMIY